MSFLGVHMDANQFGEYIMQIRDKVLSRPAMAEKHGWHVNTIKSYEKEGRLPDIDYLAALSIETGHCFSDLVNKRLMAGKMGSSGKAQQLMVGEVTATYEVSKQAPVVALPVFDSKEQIFIDSRLLPGNIPHEYLVLFNADAEANFYSQLFVFNKLEKVIQDGQLYLLDIGSGAVVRRVQNGIAGAIVLSSDQSGFAPLTVSREQIDHITVMGRVVCTINYS
ncbi:hypothetical protein [Rheinheimera aquimaris]|uniref:hypothetical protein n=1 Tax=Rheinheimera aquimaris TaxID=412437 RepID=UPI001E39FB5F|nr:hypothetical protein [Rheinheimera aquimaris]MCD1597900.1 hypothetical protein [Rheinheimera aquimaris]